MINESEKEKKKSPTKYMNRYAMVLETFYIAFPFFPFNLNIDLLKNLHLDLSNFKILSNKKYKAEI